MSGFSALVLAGSRGGEDPVATYGGAAHKALILLEGRTLLARVCEALRDAGAGSILVVSSHPDVVQAAHDLGVEACPEAAGPSLSVAQGAARAGTPLLVTTADHALLQGAWIRCFLADAPKGADVAALLAKRPTVEAAAPGTRRTYLRLADGDWLGCNLFLFATPEGLRVIDFWRRIEAERKRPWRMARMLGAGVLFAYAFRRLTLAEAARRLGERAGVRASVVESPYGLAAVDVDKPADLDLVRQLVRT